MRNRTVAIMITSIFFLLLLIFTSIFVGSFSLEFHEIISILKGELNGTLEQGVFFNLRLPRTLMALLTGLALGLAGSIYQTIFGNPLASPDITGVASGAALGAGLSIILQYTSPIAIIFFSFSFGMLTLVALFFLTALAGMRKISNFLFAGIIINALADAGLMILKTMADPQGQLAAIEFWIMGSLADVTADKILLPSIGVCFSIVILLFLHSQITILNLGGENAATVGLNPTKWRIILLSITTFMISCTVSVVGTVSFVGLISPHIALLLTRKKGFFYIFESMIIGSCVTIIADIVARSFSSGSELPLSIPIVIISVPILFFLVFKTREGYNGENS